MSDRAEKLEACMKDIIRDCLVEGGPLLGVISERLEEEFAAVREEALREAEGIAENVADHLSCKGGRVKMEGAVAVEKAIAERLKETP